MDTRGEDSLQKRPTTSRLGGVGLLLERVAAAHATLSAGQRRVAEEISKEPGRIAFMNSEEIAGAAGVSDSTVVRAAMRLGYRGYREMQRVLRETAAANILRADLFRRHVNTSPIHSGPAAVMAADEESIRATRALLDPSAVQAAAARLVQARHVAVLGTRTVYTVAYFLAFRLREVRGDVSLLGALPGTLDEELRLLGADDALVVISMARYARQIIESARVARQRGVCVIGITDSLGSPLRRWCEMALEVRAGDVSAAVVSGISLAEALVYTAARIDPKTSRRRLAVMEEALEDARVYTRSRGLSGKER